jgi:hydroxypyruvate reductase
MDKVHNILIGNNRQAALAAVKAATDIGFCAEFLSTPMHGEASLVGQAMIERVKTMLESYTNVIPYCYVTGGETTVTIKGSGKGGRNQELVLGAVKSLSSAGQMLLVSLATDGGDGPTDAAGAVATSQSYSLGLAKGLDPTDYLLRNDSYNYFGQLGDLIKIGPTMTNVNDLQFIIGR